MRPLRPVALSLALLIVTGALAGCIGGDEAPDTSPTVETGSTNETEPNATLPDGRGSAIAFEETNVTEEGAGGIEHKHDYWQGKERVDVFVDDVYFGFPLYPDGEGSEPKSVAYVKLGPPNLIYEGAAAVEVLVQAPEVRVEFDDVPVPEVALPNPAPPSLSLRYRTASSEGFEEAGTLTYGTPLTIQITPRETDMPHSVSSLWAFALVTDSPDYMSAVNVTITAIKGNDVVDWPGHPEFYVDRDSRVVLDGDFQVHRQGIEEGLMYGTASSWIAPEKLISYGTGYVDVFVNISSAQASNGATPTGFFLEYHDATILDAEDDFNDRIDDEEGGRAYDDEYYHFVVPVTAEGMDGPYQPQSRWGFRMVATFAETPVASLCPGCFAYDIAFTMKIVAHKGDDAAQLM